MHRVTVTHAHTGLRIPQSRIAAYVRRVLKREGRGNADVSVVFVGSHRMRALNRRWLAHDHDTDVMAFVLEKEPKLEGEIYVNVEQARRQAREYRISTAHEVARLVIHGTLHLVGYEDGTRKDRATMHATQEEYVEHWFSPRKTGKG